MAAEISSRLESIAHFDITISDKNLDTAAKSLIGHIKKSWDISTLHKKVYDDGITNKLIGYYLDGGDLKCSTQFGEYGRSDIVLVRIYGMKTELIIDRAQELRNFQELSREGIAPALYCTFNNGYCYQYMEGRVLGAKEFQSPHILELSAQTMAKLHSIKLSDSYLAQHPMKSNLFRTIRRYINLIPKEFSNPEKQKRFLESSHDAEKFHKEVDEIERFVSEMQEKKITFCHNDLLLANYIYEENQPKLYLIDYEYGSPNYAAYDIANHFNEFAGVDEVDYSLFPDRETQMKYLRSYLQVYNQLNGLDKTSDEELNEFYILVNKLTLASHLFWGIWALVQSYYSTIDFDFMGYSFIRLGEYFKRKEQVLSMTNQKEEAP